ALYAVSWSLWPPTPPRALTSSMYAWVARSTGSPSVRCPPSRGRTVPSLITLPAPVPAAAAALAAAARAPAAAPAPGEPGSRPPLTAGPGGGAGPAPMSFLVDPPMLVMTGAAIERLAPDERAASRASTAVLGTFLVTSGALYTNARWIRPFWEACRAETGRDWMLNSGVFGFDHRRAGWP